MPKTPSRRSSSNPPKREGTPEDPTAASNLVISVRPDHAKIEVRGDSYTIGTVAVTILLGGLAPFLLLQIAPGAGIPTGWTITFLLVNWALLAGYWILRSRSTKTRSFEQKSSIRGKQQHPQRRRNQRK